METVPEVEEVGVADEVQGKGEASREVPVVVTNEAIPVGGRLRRFRNRWKFDRWATSRVSSGLGWEWLVDRLPKFRHFKQKSTPILREFVKELLDEKAIRRVNAIWFQGRLFTVPKKGTNKLRVILDLSRLNKFIHCDKFRMLTVSQVHTLLPQNAYAISIDLTDAYWHVPIARQFTPYLGFRLGNRKYAFQSMPFGLNIVPKVFTKLAAKVVKELRNWGIQVAAYLDDWIVWASSAEECSRMASETIPFLQSLGFQIKEKKSRRQPAQAFIWLGLDRDLTSHSLSIPPQKRKDIAKLIRSFLRKTRATRRMQERVLGSLLFAAIAYLYLKVRLKSFNSV